VIAALYVRLYSSILDRFELTIDTIHVASDTGGVTGKGGQRRVTIVAEEVVLVRNDRPLQKLYGVCGTSLVVRVAFFDVNFFDVLKTAEELLNDHGISARRHIELQGARSEERGTRDEERSDKH